MKFQSPTTLAEVAAFLGCEFVGNPDHPITGINEIHVVEPGDIVFVDHPKYYNKALQSAATTILIDKAVDCPEGKGLLVSEHPFDDFNKISRHHQPYTPWTSALPSTAKIGEGTHIHPNASLGHNVTIGKNCIIHSGVVIYDNCKLGDHVIIHANTVIGASAFYYKKKTTGYDPLYTCGRVIIQDRVEIGALSTIDAGVTGDTMIGEGTKIDNQVHIGHDTVVGKNCLFAANVGIAGCVVIEDDVTLWGQVGVISDITIGKGATVLGQSGVGNTLEPGKTYLGSPCTEAREKWKEMASIRKLPYIIEHL